jgi:single-strand DNA-binding protein
MELWPRKIITIQRKEPIMAKGTINKVMLIGRLGRDPDTRFTSGGTTVTSFSVATTEKIKDEEQTEWHNVVTFGKLAEIVSEYCQKGQLVYVEGRINTQVVDKDGEKKYYTKVIANTVSFLSGGKGKSEDDAQPESGSAPSSQSDQDDLPF